MSPNQHGNYLSSKPTWYLAGIGALGTFFAHGLETHGRPVCLLLKDEQQLALYHHVGGLKVCIQREITIAYPKAFHVNNRHLSTIKYLILCCKTYDVVDCLNKLEKRLSHETVILILHNGLGLTEMLAHRFPKLRFVEGVTQNGVYQSSPFTVTPQGNKEILIGATQGIFSHDEVNTIISSLSTSQSTFKWLKNILPSMRLKFAVNCCINLPSIVYQCRNGDLLTQCQELDALIAEVATIVASCGYSITKQALESAVIKVIKNTAENISSTLQDVRKHKRTELAFLNGYLIKMAEKKGLKAPINEFLMEQYHLL